jgi:hypothetical protein
LAQDFFFSRGLACLDVMPSFQLQKDFFDPMIPFSAKRRTEGESPFAMPKTTTARKATEDFPEINERQIE